MPYSLNAIEAHLMNNYIMNWAMQLKAAAKEVIPIYCFDPRYYTKEHS